MSAIVRRKNKSAVSEVYSRMQAVAGAREVAVGFPRGKCDAYPETGQGVAEVAARHVYGLGVPVRDFMGQAQAGIIENTKKWMRLAARAPNVEAAEHYLDAAGAAGANEIKLAIRDGHYEPLAERTIERRYEKGRKSAKPLIDTAHMIGSTTWAVREKGEKR